MNGNIFLNRLYKFMVTGMVFLNTLSIANLSRLRFKILLVRY